MPPKPLISIITVCYNAQKTIEATIQSVLCQSYAPIEYIIVDGHSTDQTLAIIQKYQDKIALTISEKDLGIYDAMNKGIKRASGEIIYFLNADDSFCDTKVVEDIVAEFKSGDWDLILGLVQPVHDQVDFTAPLKNPWRTMFTRKRDIILTQICHQRMFCRKAVFAKTGLFNLKYKIFADYDWFLRAVYQLSVPIKYVERDIAFFNIQGKSHTEGASALHEKLEIILRNSVQDFLIYAWDKTLAVINNKTTDRKMDRSGHPN